MIRFKNIPGRIRILLVVLMLLIVVSVGCTSLSSPAVSSVPSYSSTSVMPSLSGVVNKVLPSVVYIYVITGDTNIFGEPIKGAGSGVILRSDGFILTNRHVVEGAKTVEVTLYDRRYYPVNLNNVWMDDVVDLAVVKIEEKNLPVLPFGSPDGMHVGDWVVAIGHALGLSPLEGGATVTDGIVSNLGRSLSIDTTSYYDLIQTSAAINPGNSGGPLVNMAGEVIGINSAGASDAQNIGFAINVGTARHVFEDLVQYGKPRHPYLGTTLGDITPQVAQKLNSPRMGALISDTEPQSPAALAGLQKNDVIISFDNVKVETAADLMKQLWRHEPGDVVEIFFWRGGNETKMNIALGQRPQTSAV